VRAALAIAEKELRQRLRDRSAIMISFVAPTLLAAIISGAFGAGFGPNSSSIHFSASIVDADQTQLSRVFVNVLTSPQLRNLVRPLRNATADEAKASIDSGSSDVVFTVPKGFEALVTSGAKTNLTVTGRASNPIYRDIGVAIARSFTEQVSADRVSVFTTLRSGAKVTNIAALAAEAAKQQAPIQVVDRGLATRPVSGANYFGPGMAMFFLFFTVGAAARSLFAEREQGTLQRLLAAPTGRSAIIAGKAGAMYVLGVVSMITMFVAMRVLFHVDWGDPLAVAVLTLLAVAAVMSLAAVVQTLAKTEQQAAAYGSMVGIVFALAGGSFFPLFQMPHIVQQISALTPNGWVLRGFTDIAYDGAKAGNLLPNFGALAAFAVVCGTYALINARRMTAR
jgi:ABC-2 type transport system permease protein